MLTWLRWYIKNTPLATIKKEWEEGEAIHPEGVKAFEYLQHLDGYCSQYDNDPPNNKVKVRQ